MKLFDGAVPSYAASDTAAELVGSGSELLLSNLRLGDSGTYVCTASNSQGSVTAHASLTVTGQLASAADGSVLVTYVGLTSRWYVLLISLILFSIKTGGSI